MELLTHLKEGVDYKESMDSKQIESQLAEMGIPYIPISWTDEFLISENLQNYFAEVIAGYSLLELKEESREYIDVSKLKEYEKNSLKVIQEKRKYHNYDFKKTQQLLLWLMKEAKKVEKLQKNEI